MPSEAVATTLASGRVVSQSNSASSNSQGGLSAQRQPVILPEAGLSQAAVSTFASGRVSSQSSCASPCKQEGLFSHGFSLQPGPAPVPAEDAPSAVASSSAPRRSLRTMWTGKRVRLRPPGERVQSKLRMQRPENKEAKKRREATAEARRKDRQRLNTAEHRACNRAAMACARVAMKKKKSDRARVEKIYSIRMAETVYRGGTWQQASQAMTDIEGRASEELPSIMPPSFVGLHEPTSLQHISEMYDFFKQTKWCTCVGCWRAWYRTPHHYMFDEVRTKTGAYRPWFQPERSTFRSKHHPGSPFLVRSSVSVIVVKCYCADGAIPALIFNRFVFHFW